MSATEAGRDLTRLEAWLAADALFGAGCRIVAVGQPKTGFSADTMMLTVQPAQGPAREIVVRVEHPGRAVFLNATIARQARMMEGLDRQGIAVPSVTGWSEDASIVGAPFLVMNRCEGMALPQHPSYYVAGPLLELDREGRDRAWRGALGTMAAINRIDWRGDFDFLLTPAHGNPGLDHYMGWIRAWRAQAYAGPHPVIDPAIAFLAERQPATAPAELLWGDSNPGNFLFSPDGSVTAALDFEAAAIGPGEIDLAWWLFLDRMLAAGNPLLDGTPDRTEQISCYEQALGRPLADLEYYSVLAALRMALVIAQTARLLIDAGRLPADNAVAVFNPAASTLAEMIGVDHDPRMDDYMGMVRAMNQR